MLIMEDQGAPDLRRFYLGHAQVRSAAGSPCRCLFGPADTEATRRFVQGEMKDIYERQKKKWNFDFELERPVPGGRYQWERVGGAPPEQSRTEAGFGATEPAATPAEPAAQPASLHQRQITDLVRTRKRTAETAKSAAAPDAAPPAKRSASSEDEQPSAPL
ncbi:cyclin-dependent kinase inhibitor 1B-like [Pollicipes pollicipes]|uniref:cyclin-dependent kinase inhibitor 1B-like n=1 Tax=Pollicipes pollicipes TaxID=41117 RepID=UPI0018859386|nr:cyclin-dependent kinase inhibitor 1B-like [Pollicipes pollicipes]